MRSAPHNANLNLRVTQVFADEVNEEFEPGAYVSGGVTYRNPRRKEELQKAIEVLAELAAPPIVYSADPCRALPPMILTMPPLLFRMCGQTARVMRT